MSSKPRVLVVDDNIDAAVMLSQLIGYWDYEVSFAHDGPTAIELARREHPHIAILDIGLPGMDGFETALELKKDPGLAKIVLIALTGYSQPSDRARAREVGFQHHLVKPIDAASLSKLLGTIAARAED